MKFLNKLSLLALGAVMAMGFGASVNNSLIEAKAETTYTLVTDASTLVTGDKVVVATKDTNNEPVNGVTGWDGNRDAAVSSTIEDWVNYTVTIVTNGFSLKDEGENQYIAKPTANHFQYSSTAGVCSVSSTGVLTCNTRELQKNGNYYRFYASTQTYDRLYVFEVGNSDSPETSAAELASVTIEGTATAIQNGEWDLSGLTVTGTDTDDVNMGYITDKCVLSTTDSTAEIGETTITVHVNYNGGVKEFNVKDVAAVVTEAPAYDTVNFGTTKNSTATELSGDLEFGTIVINNFTKTFRNAGESLKFGSSSAVGSCVLTAKRNISKVVVYASIFKDGETPTLYVVANAEVSKSQKQTVATTSFDAYEFDVSAYETKKVLIGTTNGDEQSASKRMYISQIDVHYTKTYDQTTIDEAKTWATGFLTATNVCDPNGLTNNITDEIWNGQATAFNALSDDAKELIKTAKHTDENVGEAVERYDYICTKYSKNNFAGREFETQSMSFNQMMINNTNNSLSIIAVIAVISLCSLLAICVIRRRKQTSK